MKAKLLKILNLIPGEEKQILHFALIALLWASASFSTITLSEGLFLSKLGFANLPYYYLLSSVCMPCFAIIVISSLNFFNIEKIFTAVLVLAAITTLAFSTAFQFNDLLHSPLFYFAFKLLFTLMGAIILSTFWSFTDQYYGMQQAKRTFCLFNSTIYFGDSIGGLLVAYALPHIGIQKLLMLSASLLLASTFWVLRAKGKFTPVADDAKEDLAAEKNTFKSFFKTLIRSPFSLSFVGLTLLTYIICSITEFNYQQNFEYAFRINGTVQEIPLTIFMGKCAFVVSFLHMIFGLTCYSRLVKKLGVNNLAPISSLMFICLFTGWHLVDTLWIAVLGFAIVEGIVYAVDDNNFNLLLNAVPSKIKYTVRVFLDSVVEHLGLALGGLILIFAPAEQSLFIGLLLSFICLFIVLILRSNYRDAIYQNLLETTIYFEKGLKDFFAAFNDKEKSQAQNTLLHDIYQGRPSLASFECLLKLSNPQLIPVLLRRSECLSIAERLELMKLFGNSSFDKHASFINYLRRWLDISADDNIKGEILFYLAKKQLLTLAKIAPLIDHPHELFCFSAAISILQHPSEASELAQEQASSLVYKFLEHRDDFYLLKALDALPLIFEDRYLTHLPKIFEHRNPQILQSISHTLSEILTPRHAYLEDLLFTQLAQSSDGKTRFYLIKSLVNLNDSRILIRLIHSAAHFRSKEKAQLEWLSIPLALDIPEQLLGLIKAPNESSHVKILALRVLYLSHPQIVELSLHDLLNSSCRKAMFYKNKALLLMQFPDKQVSNLVSALEAALQGEKEFLLHALLLDLSLDKVDTFVFSLSSPNEKIGSQALESIEKVCPKEMLESIEFLFSKQSYYLYPQPKKDLWRVLRLLYNELKFSHVKIDCIISAIIEKQFLFPGANLNTSRHLFKT